MNQDSFARSIVFNLKRSDMAYKNYMANGKKYLYARIIKKANEAIIDTILSSITEIPEEIEDDTLKLLEHLEIWQEHWVKLDSELTPELDDKFIFENKHQFPKSAAQNIVSYFTKK